MFVADLTGGGTRLRLCKFTTQTNISMDKSSKLCYNKNDQITERRIYYVYE